jgi:hypothetical protein
MDNQVAQNLSLILFAPWFAILAGLYWFYPRKPLHLKRRLFDLSSLTLATVASTLGMHWSFFNADPSAGSIWKQVLATLISYGLFLLVLTVAIAIRHRLFRASKPTSTLEAQR